MTLPAFALPVETPPAFLGVARSLTGKIWRDRLDARGAARALAIVQRYRLPEMLARVLAGRDVEIDGVEDFLDPTIRKLMPDPDTVTQMETAAKRIADAAMRGEKVAIFGDYDVDGATSAALLVWHYLVDCPRALVRIDRRERDQDVWVRGRSLGDLLVRHRAPPRDGLRIDGEDDRCQLAFAVVGGDVVDGRQRVVAEVRRGRLPPLRPEPVLARTTDLRVNVDVDRLDGGDVDRHAATCLTRSYRSSDRR